MNSYGNDQSISVPEHDLEDLHTWLTQAAKDLGVTLLLAHADDGVIWGRVADNTLHTSTMELPGISPELRLRTIQQCRLFGPVAELLLWKSEGDWRVRVLRDGDGPAHDHFDEMQIVWGTQAQRTPGGFTFLQEGAEGRKHAIPLAVDNDMLAKRRVRLQVRHYIDYNPDGEARIAASRLVDLVLIDAQEEEEDVVA